MKYIELIFIISVFFIQYANGQDFQDSEECHENIGAAANFEHNERKEVIDAVFKYAKIVSGKFTYVAVLITLTERIFLNPSIQ